MENRVAKRWTYGVAGPQRGIRPGQPGNRPDVYELRDGRGHEFQNDQGHDLPLNALQRTPRNIFADSERIYRHDPVNIVQEAAATGIENPSATLFAIQQKVNFTQLAYPFTVAVALALPAGGRTYLLIQNLDAAANLYLGFGFQPNGVTGVGLRIVPGGFYEPYRVPQNDVFLAGSGAGVATIIFASG